MASPTITDAFITAFNAEMHLTFEQQGSKFRGLVRTDGSVIGETLRFQKLGGLVMTTKGRQSSIPIQNPEHTHADASMADHYARVLIDKLDLSKLNVNVRQGYVTKMAGAANRKIDEIIIDAMTAGVTQTVGDASTGLTRNLALEVRETLDEAEVPDDGMRFCAITPHQESYLMTFDEYSDADKVGMEDLPYKTGGMMRRRFRNWMGINWFVTNLLPGWKTSDASCYAWHMSSVGHGIAADIESNWDWNQDKYAWDGVCALSMGATTIDPLGLVRVRVSDTVALPA